ncbi:hypothetical protein ACJX0J_000329, partial [Zea mays]
MEDGKLIWDTLEKHLPIDLPKNKIKRKKKAIWHLWHNLYFREMDHNKIDFSNYFLDTHAGDFADLSMGNVAPIPNQRATAGTVNKPVGTETIKRTPNNLLGT